MATPVRSGPVDVMVRPEQIRVIPADLRSDASTRYLVATVDDVAFYGRDASVGLQLMNASTSATNTAIRARVPGYRVPHLGDHVRLSVDDGVVAYPR